MENVFLFMGQNAFALDEERARWEAQFAEKHGADNCVKVDGAKISLRQILDEVGTAPFIASKRLVIISGMPKWTKEEAQTVLATIHPSCIVLFMDPAPDKRLGGTKHLIASVTVKEFTPLVGSALREWMGREAKKSDASLPADAAEELLSIVGTDQAMLASEIRKLALFAGGTITKEHVSRMAVPSGEQEVWHLTSLLARRDAPGALAYAQTLLRSGEDPFSLWSILLWCVRSLVSVTFCVLEGQSNPAKIASSAGVPFPTVRTLLPLAQSMTHADLSDLVAWAVVADRNVKTGGTRATGEAPQELLALIDDLITRSCRRRLQSV